MVARQLVRAVVGSFNNNDNDNNALAPPPVDFNKVLFVLAGRMWRESESDGEGWLGWERGEGRGNLRVDAPIVAWGRKAGGLRGNSCASEASKR